MNYTKFAFRGAFTVLNISLLAAFFGYLVRVVLARNLAVEEFGLFYAVFSFLGLIGIFKSLGFDKALIKFIPEFVQQKKFNFIKSSISYVVGIQVITNTIVIILVYAFSNFLAVNYFKNDQADLILRLMAIAFFVDNFVETLQSAFQGFKKMWFFSGVDFLRMLLILIIISIGIKLNYGLLSPVVAYLIVPIVLVAAFGYILFFKVFPEFWHSHFITDKKLLKCLSKYSIFVIATKGGRMILGYTDIILLTYFTGLVSVALYSIALPTARLIHYFTKSIGEILLPLTSELWTAKKFNILKAGMESLYKYMVIIILPLVLMMISFADLIINVFFGKNYIAAAYTLKILSVGMIFASLAGIWITFFSGIGKPQISSKMVYTAAIFNFIGNLVLIPILGIVGAAIATTISYFIMMAVGLLNIRKFIIIPLPIITWAKTLVAGIIFTLIIWLLKSILVLNALLEATIILAIAGMIYIALLFLLKIMTVKEVKDLYRRLA